MDFKLVWTPLVRDDLRKKLLMPNGAYITNTYDNVGRRTAKILSFRV